MLFLFSYRFLGLCFVFPLLTEKYFFTIEKQHCKCNGKCQLMLGMDGESWGHGPAHLKGNGYSASADHYCLGMWPSLARSADVSREARNFGFLNVGSVF